MIDHIRVLALTRLPRGCASSRYRAYQYVKPLKKHGIDLVVKPLYPEWLYDMRKRHGGKLIIDALTLVIALSQQIIYSISALKADVILIIKDAAPFSLVPLLNLFRRFGKPIIFDFDDAIFLKNKHVEKYVRLANVVTAGNKTLAGWTKEINPQAVVIPTVLDVNGYSPKTSYDSANKSIVIGWIGSPSTAPYLELLKTVFLKISEAHPVELHIIGGRMREIPGVKIKMIEWSEESEEQEISQFDIGIAPLPDNEWTRGKCGFKLLQYMAAGIPAVASPVGVNQEIIEHGINGFLANTEDEWTNYLSLLIESVDLRKNMGQQARHTVEQRFSLDCISKQVTALIGSLSNKEAIE